MTVHKGVGRKYLCMQHGFSTQLKTSLDNNYVDCKRCRAKLIKIIRDEEQGK